MRPVFVDWLAAQFGPLWAERLVPNPVLFYGIAMLAMLVVFVRRGRPFVGPAHELAAAAFWAMLGGLMGARLFHLLQQGAAFGPGAMRGAWAGGGTASWGAYLGAALALVIQRRVVGRPVLPVLDLGASVAGLGIAIGRLSCLFNGDDYGALSNGPLAIHYPPGSLAFAAQVRDGLIDAGAATSLGVHPVQIYLGVSGLVLFVLASVMWKRWRDRPGLLLCGYAAAYAVSRLALEMLRGDQVRYTPLELSVPQVMAMVALAVTAGWWLIASRWPARFPSFPPRRGTSDAAARS